MLNILYEDREIIVVEKPSGVASQSSGSFVPDMVSMLQNHIMAGQKEKKGRLCTELSTDRGKLSQDRWINLCKGCPGPSRPISGLSTD